MTMLKEKKKIKLPDEIENLFRLTLYIRTFIISVYFDHLSLMDFAHDDRISEGEFLRATGHYRCGQ